MKNKLKNFLEPKSIAIIGASDHPEKVGGILMKKVSNFKGQIIPINPKHQILFNKKCYSSIKEVKEKINLAIIAIPAKFVNNILIDCGKRKIQSVIIISAGFSEIGEKKLEKEIIETAKKYKINFIGPNCFGIANPYQNLDTTFSNSLPKKGNIAFISQSGALWSFASDYDIGFSGFVSLGNMADLNFSDFIEYFNHDKKTKKIILYIEKLKDGKKFIEVCKKSKKKIFVIKAGKTKESHEAAISHTGSLATDFKIYKGIFKQAKVKQVESLSKALGLKKENTFLLNKKKNKIIIVTNAGGAGTLITDKYIERGFNLIKAPIDILGTANSEDYKKALEKIKKEKQDLTIVALTPQSMSEPEKTAEIVVNYAKSKPTIAYFLGNKSIAKAKKILEKNNIPCFTKI